MKNKMDGAMRAPSANRQEMGSLEFAAYGIRAIEKTERCDHDPLY